MCGVILRSHGSLNIDLKQHCFLFMWGEGYKEETKISTVPRYCLFIKRGGGQGDEKLRETASEDSKGKLGPLSEPSPDK